MALETDKLLGAQLGPGTQHRHIDEIFAELNSSPKGLTNAEARKKRSINGANEVPPPINYPAWLCCLLPCLLRTDSMMKYNETVPDQAKLLRDGKWLTMDSHSIAPGDVIKISKGEWVAADIRVFQASPDCRFDTSMVNKRASSKACSTDSSAANYEDSPNMIFLGYYCQEGECTGVAIRTGHSTVIADLIRRGEWPPANKSN